MARITSDVMGQNMTRITSHVDLDDPVVPSYSGKSGVIDQDPLHARSEAIYDEEDHEGDIGDEGEASSTRKAVKPKKKKRKHQRNLQSNDPEDSAEVKGKESNNDLTGDGNIPSKRRGGSIIVQLDPVGEDDDSSSSEGKEHGRPSKGAPRTSPVQNQQIAFTGPHSSRKRKRGEISQLGPRRSNRAAAKTATAHITEQSNKRPKAQASAVATPPAAPKRKTRASTAGAARGKQEYEVEKIVDSRLNKKTGEAEYLVKWAGYPRSDNTWEPADNLTHCTQKLKQYRASQKAK